MSATLTLIASLFVFPADAADKASLEALAAASGRPRECQTRGKKRSKRPSVWQRAREPELVPYCDLVAKAHILLGSESRGDAELALEAAVKAGTAWPGHAGSLLVEGRALLLLGKPKDALERFERAKQIDKLSVEEPRTMRAHARAFIESGDVASGAALYRVLVPRASLLPDRLRASVLLEAAYASMTEAGKQPGKLSLVEALAFAGEARALDHASLGPDVLLALALVHDRAGEQEQAQALLREAKGLVVSSPSNKLLTESLVAEKADTVALSALGLELDSPAEAQKLWASYQVSAPVEPFKRAAAARAAALSGSKSGGAKPKKGK